VLAIIAGGASVYAYDRVSRALHRVNQATDVRAQRSAESTVVPTLQPPTAQQSAAPDHGAGDQAAPLPTPTPAAAGVPADDRVAAIEQPFTVLVIGVDVRPDADPRTMRADTLMLLRVDPRDRSAALLSLPRDTQVTIPSKHCVGAQKINAAYACGYGHPAIYGADASPVDAGAALAAETVENFLGVRVDYTAQVNFAGFVDVVDALGGVPVDVPQALEDPAYPTADYGTQRVYFPAGRQTLNGERALQYVRTRHADSDFGRAERQQQVLIAALRKLRQQNTLSQIGSASRLLDIVSANVRTTLPLDDLDTLRDLALIANDVGNDRIQRLVLRPETDADGSQNLRMVGTAIEWQPAYVREVVRQFLGGSPAGPEKAGGS
jgi:polyisoprenyl-teichoic acid--peptidoglycan teichoic acid transferase